MVDGVVLIVIQITDDPSAERTAPPRSTHIWLGRRLLQLYPARGKERLMKIQQHDGVVVDASAITAGLRQAFARGGGVAGEREAPETWVRLPSLPSSLYRAPRGGTGPRRSNLQGGAAAKGVACPPRQVEAPPTPRVSNPRSKGAQGGRTSPPGAGSPPTSAHGALWDRWPHPVDPRDPSDGPGTIPVTPETFPVAETRLPIYNSSPPDHSGTANNFRVSAY